MANGTARFIRNFRVVIQETFGFVPLFDNERLHRTVEALDICDIGITVEFRSWTDAVYVPIGLALPLVRHSSYHIYIHASERFLDSCIQRRVSLRSAALLGNIGLIADAIIYHEFTHIALRKKRGDPFRSIGDYAYEEGLVIPEEEQYIRSLLTKAKLPFLNLTKRI